MKRIINIVEVWFEWFFVDLICKYGMDWKRFIFFWLGVVNVIFFLLFWVMKSVEGFLSFFSFFDYEYFSIVIVIIFGYGDYYFFGVGRIIVLVEVFFGMFMWVVFFIVFVRKYMR